MRLSRDLQPGNRYALPDGRQVTVLETCGREVVYECSRPLCPACEPSGDAHRCLAQSLLHVLRDAQPVRVQLVLWGSE